ncbi:riboflavin kinase [Duncaniella dubosii]
MTVEFISFLRPEKRFSSTEKLREQLERDTQSAKKALS